MLDNEVRKTKIKDYQYLVPITARRMKRYINPHIVIDQDDLIGAGNIALVKAVDQFLPGKGTKFETYAIAMIRGGMLEYIRGQRWLPRSVYDSMREVYSAIEEVKSANGGYEPSMQDIARKLGVSEEKVQTIKQKIETSQYLLSLDCKAYGIEDEGDENVLLGETIPALEPTVEELALQAEINLAVIAAVQRLPEREKFVIEHYYGIKADLSLRQICSMQHISESRSHQLLRQGLRRLRNCIRWYQGT